MKLGICSCDLPSMGVDLREVASRLFFVERRMRNILSNSVRMITRRGMLVKYYLRTSS